MGSLHGEKTLKSFLSTERNATSQQRSPFSASPYSKGRSYFRSSRVAVSDLLPVLTISTERLHRRTPKTETLLVERFSAFVASLAVGASSPIPADAAVAARKARAAQTQTSPRQLIKKAVAEYRAGSALVSDLRDTGARVQLIHAPKRSRIRTRSAAFMQQSELTTAASSAAVPISALDCCMPITSMPGRVSGTGRTTFISAFDRGEPAGMFSGCRCSQASRSEARSVHVCEDQMNRQVGFDGPARYRQPRSTAPHKAGPEFGDQLRGYNR